MNSIIDNRGGSESSFTDEMLKDLKDVVLSKSPETFGYMHSSWTTALLAQYIEDKYGKSYSQEWIRQLLISLDFSFKRGQYKPTKGDAELQAIFKKIADLLPIIENTDDSVLYVEDETGIRLESANRRSWSPIGQSPIVESNNTRASFNIIGATEISKNYNNLINIYPAQHSITSIEMLEFLKQLVEQNKCKKIFLIWDNYKVHKAKIIEEFAELHKEKLFLINLPTYSPMLNPQENV